MKRIMDVLVQISTNYNRVRQNKARLPGESWLYCWKIQIKHIERQSVFKDDISKRLNKEAYHRDGVNLTVLTENHFPCFLLKV